MQEAQDKSGVAVGQVCLWEVMWTCRTFALQSYRASKPTNALGSISDGVVVSIPPTQPAILCLHSSSCFLGIGNQVLRHRNTNAVVLSARL